MRLKFDEWLEEELASIVLSEEEEAGEFGEDVQVGEVVLYTISNPYLIKLLVLTIRLAYRMLSIGQRHSQSKFNILHFQTQAVYSRFWAEVSMEAPDGSLDVLNDPNSTFNQIGVRNGWNVVVSTNNPIQMLLGMIPV